MAAEEWFIREYFLLNVFCKRHGIFEDEMSRMDELQIVFFRSSMFQIDLRCKGECFLVFSKRLGCMMLGQIDLTRGLGMNDAVKSFNGF